MSSNRQGFSVVELMVVLLVVGLLAAIALAKIRGSSERAAAVRIYSLPADSAARYADSLRFAKIDSMGRVETEGDRKLDSIFRRRSPK